MNIPSELKINPRDVKRLSKRRTLKPGWYAFLTGGSKRDASPKKGTLAIQQILFPLKDPKDPKSKSTPTIRNGIWMPFPNPEVEGHKAPNTVGLCHSIFLAFEPDSLPSYPSKIDGVLTYQGEEIEPSEEEAAREEVTEATMQKCLELWENPSLVDNMIIFGEVFDNNGFANVRNISAELPEDAELLPVEQWGEDDEDEAESEPEKPAKGKPAAKKAAAKKKK